MSSSVGVDLSSMAADNFSGTVGIFVDAAKLMSRLSPRNRYLLARTLWVMFDLDAQLPARPVRALRSRKLGRGRK